MSTETTIAKAVKTLPAPRGYNGQIIITAHAYQLGGNQHPHFSVTGEISTERERKRGDAQVCGCIHDECLAAWPAVAPLIALHLSNADDGEPMHAEGNGFYDLAGAVEGNFGERYHRGNSKLNMPATPPADYEHREPTHDECLAMLAEHLRCPPSECEAIREKCVAAYREGVASVASSEEITDIAREHASKAGKIRAKAVFRTFVNAQRERWQKEAQDGIALIHNLAGQ